VGGSVERVKRRFSAATGCSARNPGVLYFNERQMPC
jgi:hypothetical protein